MSSLAISVLEDRDTDWLRADAMPQVVNLSTPKTAALFCAIASSREASRLEERPSIDLDDLLAFDDSDPEFSADLARDMDDRWDD